MLNKALLDIKSLSKEEVIFLIEKALKIKRNNNNGFYGESLKNKNVATLFYENSTRTKNSFENAVKFLSGNVISLDVAKSSVQKGESIEETAKTLQMLKTDLVIIRHQISGMPFLLNNLSDIKIINAGDGCHAHPTQALLDAMTIYEHYGRLGGLRMLIVGDIKHSRVFRSNYELLKKFDSNISILAPNTLSIDNDICEKLNIIRTTNIKEAIEQADIIMPLRMQAERQNIKYIPSLSEYSRFYRIEDSMINDNQIIMHPGPVNIGIELSNELLLNDKKCMVHKQVENGLFMRMAILDTMLGGDYAN